MARKKREIAPVHPGEILSEEFLKPLGLSMNQLALALRVPGNRINAIVAESAGSLLTLRLGSVDTSERHRSSGSIQASACDSFLGLVGPEITG